MSKAEELVSVVTEDGSAVTNNEDNCYNRLITEGHLTDGDHGIAPKDIPLDWVDPDLVKKGQEYFRSEIDNCYVQCMSLSFKKIHFTIKLFST
jgi:hypothetical protein